MNRRNIFSYVFATLIFFSSTSATLAENYIVSGNPNAPPVVWSENNILTGFAPDLASSIFNLLDIPYNIEEAGNWQDVQNKTRAGKIDMILSAYVNKEREEYLLFSEPYLSQPVVAIVKKGNEFKLSDGNALIGKKGVSNVGESYGEEFDQFLKANLDIAYYQFERAIQMLMLDEADYIIADLYTALIYTALLQGDNSISILDPPLTVQSFHFAMQKNSTISAYLPDINSKIKDKIKNGEIKNLFFKHFDSWKQRIEKRSQYLEANQKKRSEQNETYRKTQDEIARERIIKTMTERDGLPEGI